MNSLRAFEAAARHLNFSRAAEEIALSQGAVSRHIALLEDYLGVPLFRRMHREVALTDFGREYFREIQKSLDVITEVTDRINQRRVEHPLRINALPTFATKWLMPRLADFANTCPEVDTSISTFHGPADFSSGDLDAAVEYGTGEWKGLTSDILFHINLTPVCRPVLADDRPAPNSLLELRNYTLLHSFYRPDLWQRWLTAAHGPDPSTMRSTQLQTSALVYQAASDGLGIAMAELTYVLEDIKAGRLVAPFRHKLKGREGYYLVYPPGKRREKSFAQFRSWILKNAEACRDEISLLP